MSSVKYDRWFQTDIQKVLWEIMKTMFFFLGGGGGDVNIQ